MNVALLWVGNIKEIVARTKVIQPTGVKFALKTMTVAKKLASFSPSVFTA